MVHILIWDKRKSQITEYSDIIGKPIQSLVRVKYFVVLLFLQLLMPLESSKSLLVLNGVTALFNHLCVHKEGLISSTFHCFGYYEHIWGFFHILFLWFLLWVRAIVTRDALWSLLVMSINLWWYINFPRCGHLFPPWLHMSNLFTICSLCTCWFPPPLL